MSQLRQSNLEKKNRTNQLIDRFKVNDRYRIVISISTIIGRDRIWIKLEFLNVWNKYKKKHSKFCGNDIDIYLKSKQLYNFEIVLCCFC